MAEFSSEGFDLDAVAASEGDDVVYEVGGGATVLDAAMAKDKESPKEEGAGAAMLEAEELKKQGNEFFKAGNYSKACELYSSAIDACPDVLSAEEIIQQQAEFVEEQRIQALSRHKLHQQGKEKPNEEDKDSQANEKEEKPKKFQLPPQPNADKLAVYYCNRAAARTQMGDFEEATKDCDVAILLDPTYVKGYVRRSTAFEKNDKTEQALEDAKTALSMDPNNATLKKSVARLQKLENERLEKLKEETMGKLKDLGNSLLGNFGLSLDNFQAVKDPNTGSYSISFNQNAN